MTAGDGVLEIAAGVNIDGEPSKNPMRDVVREVALFFETASSFMWLSSVLKLVESVDCVEVCLRANTGLNQLSILDLRCV